jgi:hypothetical protein
MNGEMLKGSSGLAGPMGVQLEVRRVAMDGMDVLGARLKRRDREFCVLRVETCRCVIVFVCSIGGVEAFGH